MSPADKELLAIDLGYVVYLFSQKYIYIQHMKINLLMSYKTAKVQISLHTS